MVSSSGRGGGDSNNTAAIPGAEEETAKTNGSLLTAPYTRHFYPVLGVLNAPQLTTDGGNSPPPGSSSSNSSLQLTPYARQVGRSILKHFGSSSSSSRTTVAAAGGENDEESEGDDGQCASGWDPPTAGPSRGRRWQTVGFGRVDDIPRRKIWRQKGGASSKKEAGDPDSDLSPRCAGSELWGEGLMTPQWIAKQQQRRPATVVSLHALHQGTSSGGSDTLLAEELARNRVCLAAFGLTYTAVVIISRAHVEEDAKGTEARLTAIMQRSGLDQPQQQNLQFAVCRPGSAHQFQRFVIELERRLFARAAAYYADSFVRTQKKLVAIPQLPVPADPTSPHAVYRSLHWSSEARATTTRLFESDRSLVAKYSRFLPLRAWLVRYHFKLAVSAECAGDRDTAQRCHWMAYVHLVCYLAEIASGAYLPRSDGNHSSQQQQSEKQQQLDVPPQRGWMWALNGGDGDGQRAHNLRMFGKRWMEAIALLEAIHLRLVRGWLYQSMEVAAMRAKNQQSVFSVSGASIASSGWATYGFGNQQQQQQRPYIVAPVNRSGASGSASSSTAAMLGILPASPRSPGSPASGAPVSTAAGVGSSSTTSITRNNNGAGISGTNGCLEPFVFSVHAGEANAATGQLMRIERARRAEPKEADDNAVCFLALGSETGDVDLLLLQLQQKEQPTAEVENTDQPWWPWWPLGGMVGVLDFGKTPQQQQMVPMPLSQHLAAADERIPGLVLNSSQDVSSASLMLPQGNQLDQTMTAAARQCAEHVVSIARVLLLGGFGDSSSYFWALVARQYRNHADLYQIAADHGVGFARQSIDAPTDGKQMQMLTESLVQSLRVPRIYKPIDTKLASRQCGPDEPFAGFVFSRALSSASPTETRSASSNSSCVFPQWIWPESAAPLLYAAALARRRQYQRLAREERVYLSGTADNDNDNDGSDHAMSAAAATPGVASTYAAVWLVPEQQKRRKASAGSTSALSSSAYVPLLLAAALRSVAHADTQNSAVIEQAAAEIVADFSDDGGQRHTADDALVRLIRGSRRRAIPAGADTTDPSRMCLFLAAELAEVYAAESTSIHSARALEIFALLADRYRSEGWAILTAHALRRVLQCSKDAASGSSEIRAMVELLSPLAVPCKKERIRMGERFKQYLAESPDPLTVVGADQPSQQADVDPVVDELKIDMTRIYSPIGCHAHWRHWRPGPAGASPSFMAFQVVVDCTDVHVLLEPSELCIRLCSGGAGQANIRLAGGSIRNNGAEAATEKVVVASGVDGGATTYYRDIGTVGDDGSATTTKSGSISLQLHPSSITVFEGRLSLAEDDLRRLFSTASGANTSGAHCSSVTLDSVSLYFNSGGGEWRLRMFWPTCAAAIETAGDCEFGDSYSAAVTPGRLAASTGASSSAAMPKLLSTSGAEENEDSALNHIERLILCSAGISRMQGGAGRTLGPSSQLTLAPPTLGASTEDHALRRAICIAGPEASLPAQRIRRWLHVSGDRDARWVQLPAPPLTSADTTSAEPAVSAYSRCRALYLPEPEPALTIAVDPHATATTLAPAYRGEAFPVSVVVTNTHRSRSVTRLEVGVTLRSAASDDTARQQMSDLDVAADKSHPGAAFSSPRSSTSSANAEQQSIRPPVSAAENLLGSASDAPAVGYNNGNGNGAPWLSAARSEDNDSSAAQQRVTVLSIDVIRQGDQTDSDPAPDSLKLAPGESKTVTVHVHFPPFGLSAGSAVNEEQNQEERVPAVSLEFVARYAFDDDTEACVSEPESGAESAWSGRATTHTNVPVIRALYAHAEALPSQPQSTHSVLDGDGWLMTHTVPGSLPATLLSAASTDGNGEFCFRRPILVTLVNKGPWEVAVKQLLLRPPLVEAACGVNSIPMRVQLAGFSADGAAASLAPLVVAGNGGTLKEVFWLDIYTTDVIRMPTTVSPGTLEIRWERVASEQALVPEPMPTRLWLAPLELLVRKQVQVDMQISAPVARVGRMLTVCYRVLNPTRVVQTVETAMHASDSFVFSGLRKTTLNILPGHIGFLRFNLVPLASATSAVAQNQQQQQPVEYAPGHAVLGLMGRAASATAAVALPGSNLTGLGWTALPRLDVRLVSDTSGDNDDDSSVLTREASAASVAGGEGRRSTGALQSQITRAPSSALGQRNRFSPPALSAPPPSRATLLSSGSRTADATLLLARRARKAVVALSGLEIPSDNENEDENENEAEERVDVLLSPGLARSCVDLVPDYFVQPTMATGGGESDVDSDYDYDGSEDDAAPALAAVPADARDAASPVVLRYDQTTIFCFP
ncbi:hypothetical protein GGH99_001810 [Coemansia sp. RSA 1285]|nr:hypothetical protein GGH99_001810 [Coemansia sp. RSA 1285]